MAQETSLDQLPQRSEPVDPNSDGDIGAYMAQQGCEQPPHMENQGHSGTPAPPPGSHYQGDVPGSPAQDRGVYGPRQPGMPPSQSPFGPGCQPGGYGPPPGMFGPPGHHPQQQPQQSGSMMDMIMAQAKLPLLVAAVFAVLSMPAVKNMLATQVGYLAGEMPNLGARALLAALAVWALLRFVPL